MQLEPVQRWVITALVTTMATVWVSCQIWAAVGILEPERMGARVAMLVIAAAITAMTIVGVRFLHQRRWKSPWLVLALVPLAFGLILM